MIWWPHLQRGKSLDMPPAGITTPSPLAIIPSGLCPCPCCRVSGRGRCGGRRCPAGLSKLTGQFREGVCSTYIHVHVHGEKA